MSNKWEKAGIAGVDAGMIWIGDPCYFIPDNKLNKRVAELGIKVSKQPKKPPKPLDEYGDFCDVVLDPKRDNKLGFLQFNYEAGHAGLGVLVDGFGGDGVFDVFIKRGADGLVSAAKIVFSEDDENEEE